MGDDENPTQSPPEPTLPPDPVEPPEATTPPQVASPPPQTASPPPQGATTPPQGASTPPQVASPPPQADPPAGEPSEEQPQEEPPVVGEDPPPEDFDTDAFELDAYPPFDFSEEQWREETEAYLDQDCGEDIPAFLEEWEANGRKCPDKSKEKERNLIILRQKCDLLRRMFGHHTTAKKTLETRLDELNAENERKAKLVFNLDQDIAELRQRCHERKMVYLDKLKKRLEKVTKVIEANKSIKQKRPYDSFLHQSARLQQHLECKVSLMEDLYEKAIADTYEFMKDTQINDDIDIEDLVASIDKGIQRKNAIVYEQCVLFSDEHFNRLKKRTMHLVHGNLSSGMRRPDLLKDPLHRLVGLLFGSEWYETDTKLKPYAYKRWTHLQQDKTINNLEGSNEVELDKDMKERRNDIAHPLVDRKEEKVTIGRYSQERSRMTDMTYPTSEFLTSLARFKEIMKVFHPNAKVAAADEVDSRGETEEELDNEKENAIV